MRIFPPYACGSQSEHVCFFLMNRSVDPQPSHLGQQGGSLHSEFGRRAAWPNNDPANPFQRLNAFQKIQRNSRATNFYESTSAALTGVVNGMCDEFLACTGFPLNQDSRVGGRNQLYLVENTFQSGAIADDPIESTFGLVPRKVRNCCIICHKILLSRHRVRLL